MRESKSVYMDVKYLSPLHANAKSPSPLPGPPNSERISDASSNVLSPSNHSMDVYDFNIAQMKQKRKKNEQLSMSKLSFITLFDEQKEIETELDLDDDNYKNNMNMTP